MIIFFERLVQALLGGFVVDYWLGRAGAKDPLKLIVSVLVIILALLISYKVF